MGMKKPRAPCGDRGRLDPKGGRSKSSYGAEAGGCDGLRQEPTDHGVKSSAYIYPHAEIDTDLTGAHAQRPVRARFQQSDLVRSSGQMADVELSFAAGVASDSNRPNRDIAAG